jgi:hypothetical protein
LAHPTNDRRAAEPTIDDLIPLARMDFGIFVALVFPVLHGRKNMVPASYVNLSRGNAVQQAHRFPVEIAQALALEPIGQDTKQQVARQMFRRFAPEHGAPPRAQVRKIEIAQTRDLVFKLGAVDHRITSGRRMG